MTLLWDSRGTDRIMILGFIQSLEALSEFIEAQKILLARTRSDLDKLQELRKDVLEGAEETIAHVIEKVLIILDIR